MSGPTDNLDVIVEQVRINLTAKDKAREKMLPMSREAIRCCSESIRAMHRQELDKAGALLGDARNLLRDCEAALEDSPELVNTGALRDAQKEYVEAAALLNIVTNKLLPTPDELGVESSVYMNGLGEAASELRRYLLDSMRKGDLSQSEAFLTAMDDIYSVMVTIDFPDAITGGLRRTTDQLRGVLERTRSDLTLIITQKSLGDKLDRLEKKL